MLSMASMQNDCWEFMDFLNEMRADAAAMPAALREIAPSYFSVHLAQ